jgi:hypothetical protein
LPSPAIASGTYHNWRRKPSIVLLVEYTLQANNPATFLDAYLCSLRDTDDLEARPGACCLAKRI